MKRSAVLSGVVNSVLASMCCLPGAFAISFGLSLGTIASLQHLLVYQRFFQAGGIALTVLLGLWIARRSVRSCNLEDRKQGRERTLTYVFGTFVLSFLVLNILVIPLLERHTP